MKSYSACSCAAPHLADRVERYHDSPEWHIAPRLGDSCSPSVAISLHPTFQLSSRQLLATPECSGRQRRGYRHRWRCRSVLSTALARALVGPRPEMPQKEAGGRTPKANSIKGGAGVPPRRSLRLLSAAESRGGAAAAAPCRRSPRLLSSAEGSGGAGPAGGVAATPGRRSARLLSQGGDCVGGGLAGPPNSTRSTGSSARSRPQSLKILGLRRSSRVSKMAAESCGVAHADATGGGDALGDCRRRSARLRGSMGEGSLGVVGSGNGSDERGGNLWRERKGNKKGVSAVPTKRAAKRPGRAEVESAVSAKSGSDVNVVKGKKKRDISVVSATKGGRDQKRKQTMETKEELDPQRRDVESGSGCPGWTSKQEIALQRAYILAKPSPHFWKKVAKLVPGKSAQECFDRMHSKVVTPLPVQPRSRVKTTDCSPLGFSDLLKKDAKRPKSSTRKGLLLAHKTVRHILRKHSVMDQGREADLFSVLETSPNLHADLSQIKMLSIPGYIIESPELVQRSNENLSSSHKKVHSTLKSQVQANFTSPEVLKPVKNIALHEKYIDELHCREARRRMYATAACSVSSEDDKENAVLKDDVVKAAKNALVSEARGIICQLGHTRFSPLSNFEDTEISEDEYEEDM